MRLFHRVELIRREQLDHVHDAIRVDDEPLSIGIPRSAAPVNATTSERIQHGSLRAWWGEETMRFQRFELPAARASIQERETPRILRRDRLRHERRRAPRN